MTKPHKDAINEIKRLLWNSRNPNYDYQQAIALTLVEISEQINEALVAKCGKPSSAIKVQTNNEWKNPTEYLPIDNTSVIVYAEDEDGELLEPFIAYYGGGIFAYVPGNDWGDIREINKKRILYWKELDIPEQLIDRISAEYVKKGAF